MTLKAVSLRLSIGSAFAAIVIITSLLLGAATFYSARSFVRNGIRERLGDIAAIGALQIRADQHRLLQKPEDERAEDYLQIKKRLQQIRDRGTGLRFVYTLRQTAAGYQFIVDAEENPEDLSHLGEIYEDPTPFMVAAFTPPYKVQVEDRFFTDQWGTWLSSYAPFFDTDGRLEGVLAIDMAADDVLSYERRYLILTGTTALLICIPAILLGLYVARRICKPMMQLELEMSQIQQFQLDTELPLTSRVKEIASMKTAVDNMKNGLRSFKKYVPATLVAELIRLRREAVLGAEKQPLTIFFSDIANFTTISEQLTPETLVRQMGVYFSGLTEIVLKHQGTVDKYIGDSIMAFWNAPQEVDDHAVLACRAALDCQRFLESFNHDCAEKGLPPFTTRIGINSGDALVGNIGTEERLNYTVMGDSVNIASRLEGLNKVYSTAILISESTFLQVRHLMLARIVDRTVVKGKSIGVTFYELIAERSEIDPATISRIERYNQLMEACLCGRGKEIAEEARAFVRDNPDDEQAAHLLERLS